MKNSLAIEHHHHEADERDVFGFWLYILTDCVLFSCLFATYAVLSKNVYGGLGIKDLTSLPYVFTETMVLLLSSFTYGMAVIGFYKHSVTRIMWWLGATFLLGFAFIGLEVTEFVNLYKEGHSWQASAALSSFFTLVGTHGLHVAFGLLTMIVLMIQFSIYGITPFMKRRLAYLGIFWSFLDIIWIFVFTIVYLMGSI
jgi:cytochrome o ubiquinol oxidase subunit 3